MFSGPVYQGNGDGGRFDFFSKVAAVGAGGRGRGWSAPYGAIDAGGPGPAGPAGLPAPTLRRTIPPHPRAAAPPTRPRRRPSSSCCAAGGSPTSCTATTGAVPTWRAPTGPSTTTTGCGSPKWCGHVGGGLRLRGRWPAGRGVGGGGLVGPPAQRCPRPGPPSASPPSPCFPPQLRYPCTSSPYTPLPTTPTNPAHQPTNCPHPSPTPTNQTSSPNQPINSRALKQPPPSQIFTIHNMDFGQIKLGEAAYYSQKFTTVSPSYAWEVRGGVRWSAGLWLCGCVCGCGRLGRQRSQHMRHRLATQRGRPRIADPSLPPPPAHATRHRCCADRRAPRHRA